MIRSARANRLRTWVKKITIQKGRLKRRPFLLCLANVFLELHRAVHAYNVLVISPGADVRVSPVEIVTRSHRKPFFHLVVQPQA